MPRPRTALPPAESKSHSLSESDSESEFNWAPGGLRLAADSEPEAAAAESLAISPGYLADYTVVLSRRLHGCLGPRLPTTQLEWQNFREPCLCHGCTKNGVVNNAGCNDIGL